MALDPEVDAAYPQRWIGKVTVQTTDGRTLHGRVDEPKGDPGNTLSREEITAKALRLAAYGGQVPAAQVQQAVQQLWQVAQWPRVRACWTELPAGMSAAGLRACFPRGQWHHRNACPVTKETNHDPFFHFPPLFPAACACGAVLALGAGSAMANNWPEKPVTWSCPTAPAAPPTWWRACWPCPWARCWARACWWKTPWARAAPSPRPAWPRPRRRLHHPHPPHGHGHGAGAVQEAAL
jgi:hypothetical protein